MRVRKALIPAAGRGTRMRPVTRSVPKELLPVGTTPAVHRVVDEAAAAGLEQIAVVLAPGKELIRDYLEGAAADGLWRGVALDFPIQREPTGLADAILAARDLLAGEPFALLLPDNLPLAPGYRLAGLTSLFERTGRDVVGVLELDSASSGDYGNSGRFEGRAIEPGVWRIHRLEGKRPGRLTIAAGETVRRTCGRYVCHPRLLERIAELRPAGGGEVDEVPAYQRIAREGGLLGRSLPPPLFDVGHPSGYLAANAYLHAGRDGRER